jgi:hypothetical protein
MLSINQKNIKILICFFMMAIISNHAMAQDEQCETLESCKTKLTLIQIKITELSKSALYLKTQSALYKRMEKVTALGKTWRDSDYLVWGDVYNNGSSIITVNFQEAKEYCEKIGAKLPTAQDFVRLKIGMGGSHLKPKEKGDYKPQILPNLNVHFSVWTSTTHTLSNGEQQAILFQGMMGRFDEKKINYNQAGVRCVITARDFKKL